MKKFEDYLEANGEVGYVEEITPAIALVAGLPSAHAGEVIIFETGEIGQVMSMNEQAVEVLLFFKPRFSVGTKAARTGKKVEVTVPDNILGKIVSPLDQIDGGANARPLEPKPVGISGRQRVTHSLETGVGIVDLIIPLGLGQRELVIGDRKTGKTEFLSSLVSMQASRGLICIYAAIGKRKIDTQNIAASFVRAKAMSNVAIVATSAADSSGLIFLTPYVAMSIAEHFRDAGRDVLVILDDLTIHAKFYREISLLGGRFPGRSSYPGDIFYIHSRLMERAGKFKKGSITTLAVAETVVSDLSGYVQTNLMAMTDGHLFFDADLYGLGRRPAINPFLSVTRVGKQTQSPLLRDVTTKLTNFLVDHERLSQYMHFGAELNEKIRSQLALGERFYILFNQHENTIYPMNVNLFLAGALWADFWKEAKAQEIRDSFAKIREAYATDKTYHDAVDQLLAKSKDLTSLISNIKTSADLVNKYYAHT